ncbi:MAG: hydrogenase maturation nickel metallochaperone HypA, partial [Succiniclasticum sp.]|nr:hydrogenase maturation nickel metallochaperone HypA [Succiniclasticum sp.]
MHEYPVTVRIVEIAEETAEKRKAKVRRIDLVVGKDSGFIGESIQMYFDIVAEGTRCEGAKLFIEGVEPRLRCTQCGELFARRLYSFACPSCGGEGEPTAIGKEFYIKSMELET